MLLLAVQDEQKAIPEKMVLRMYTVSFSSNYVEKQAFPNTNSWMLVTKTGWEPKEKIVKAVQEKIREKMTVQVQEQHPKDEPKNQLNRTYEQDKDEFKYMLNQVMFEANMMLPGPQQSPLQPRVLAPQSYLRHQAPSVLPPCPPAPKPAPVLQADNLMSFDYDQF